MQLFFNILPQEETKTALGSCLGLNSPLTDCSLLVYRVDGIVMLLKLPWEANCITDYRKLGT
jgi:hypothetical protein